MNRQERQALDRWITREQPDPCPDFVEVEYDMPEPCDECNFVGMHGEGCSLA